MILASNRYALQRDKEKAIAAEEQKYKKVCEEVTVLQEEIYGSPLSREQSWDKLALLPKLKRVRYLLNSVVWTNCEPKTMVQNQGVVATTFMLPKKYASTGVRPSGLVYVFDSGADYVAEKVDTAAAGTAAPAEAPATEDPAAAPAPKVAAAPAHFLGVFRVDRINQSEISLSSVNNMTAEEVAFLNKSVKDKKGWFIIPDRPPIDSPDDIAFFKGISPDFEKTLTDDEKAYFARTSFNEDELIALPVQVKVSEDGKKRTPNDFAFLLRNNFTKRDDFNIIIARKETALSNINTVLINQIVAMGTEMDENAKALVNNDAFQKAKQANKITTYFAMETSLKKSLDDMTKQRDLVKKRYELVLSYKEQIQAKVKELLNKNSELAVSIANAQFQALKKIMGKNVQAVPNSEGGSMLQFRKPQI